MKIKKSSITIENITVFYMLLISYTVGLHETLFGGNTIIYFLMIGLNALCLALSIRKYGVRIDNDISSILLLVAFFPVFINNQNIAHNSFLKSTYEIGFICIVALYFCLKQNPKWKNMLSKIMLFAGCVHAMITLLSAIAPGLYKAILPLLGSNYSLVFYQYNQGLYPGLTAHYSTNAMYLSLGIGVCVANILVDKGRKITNIFIMLCVVGALLFTGKRGHIIFSAMGIFILYYISMRGKKLTKLFKMIGLMLICLTVFTVISSYVPQLNSVVNRFSALVESGDVTNGRDEQVAVALLYFNQHKLFGIGWDAFKYLYKNASGVALNVHCVYVQLLCETGIIGFVIFVAFFLSELIKAIKVLIFMTKATYFTANDMRNVYAVVFTEIFFLLYCFTGNPLYDMQMFFPYMLSCAFIGIQSKENNSYIRDEM